MTVIKRSEGGLSNNGNLDYRLKVVMVGNSAVGKSSMLSSYVDNNFQFNTAPTLDIDFKVISTRNTLVQRVARPNKIVLRLYKCSCGTRLARTTSKPSQKLTTKEPMQL
jgi:GTPase SAR1 family protein